MSQTRAIVDKLLTQASSGLFLPDMGLVADMLLPTVPVVQSTGKLGKYGSSHLRIEKTLAGGRGAYRRAEAITRETDSYAIEDHGLEGMVTEDDYANVESPFDAEVDETEGLTASILLEKEKALADLLASTSVMALNTTLSGTSQFSDKDNSDPIGVCEVARAAVRDACGVVPNVAVMDWKVKNVLRHHPALLDLLGFKFGRPGGLTDEELARALDVEKVLIAKSVYNSAKEGQTASLAAVWGKHLIFAVAPSAARVRQISLGYQVRRTDTPSKQVFKYGISNPPNATGIIVRDKYDWFLTSSATAGYLVKNAIA